MVKTKFLSIVKRWRLGLTVFWVWQFQAFETKSEKDYIEYLSLEQDKNSRAESTARPLTQSLWPVKVIWHAPAFHILIVLSAEPGKSEK